MIKTILMVALLPVAFGANIISAQTTPNNLSDLIGVRASSGESELRSRGYVFVKTSEGSDRKWSNWWNNGRSQCITVATVDGRYDSIVTSPAFDCNRSSGGSSNGGQTSSPPSWARGTWYWTGGPDRMLVIESNGGISVQTGGKTYYGSYNNGSITLNNDTSTLSRSGNQIKTYNRNTGETSSYARSSYGGGNSSGGSSRPPSWAVGTWYWVEGYDRVLTISNNGIVTVLTGGSTYSGTYNNGSIILNNDVSTINQQGNRIQTYNQTNGVRSTYSKSKYDQGANAGSGNGNKVELSDLLGVRASSGESEFRSRGFRNVDSFKRGSASYTIWWRRQSQQCIQVATTNGRFDSVTDIQTHQRCR